MTNVPWWQIIVASAVTGALASGVFSLLEGWLNRRNARNEAVFELRVNVYREVLLALHSFPTTLDAIMDRAIRNNTTTETQVEQYAREMLTALAPIRAQLIHATPEIQRLANSAFEVINELPEAGQTFMQSFNNRALPAIATLAQAMGRELHPD